MQLDETKIRQYLTHYGADIEAWPEDIQVLGILALRHPVCASFFTEEQRFENLLYARAVSPMSANLAERIIAAAYTHVQSIEPPWNLSLLLKGINPAAFAAMLVIGFAIGFGALAPDVSSEAASLQSYSDDEGAAL